MASDAELIGRSLSGDAAAFMEVISRHEVAIGGYLERRAGREAAEDLLGDVWAAAFKYRGTYDQSFAGARPWLYTMALNRLRQYWRSRSPEDLVPDVAEEKGVRTPIPMPTGRLLQQDIDNTLWTASTIALSWGAADPQIRVGVLRLLSTLPQVTVADSTTGGQPTLTITAGPALFGAGGGDQVLTVNARTGMPVSSVESGGGLATAVETDQVSRVTVAAIEAGQF